MIFSNFLPFNNKRKRWECVREKRKVTNLAKKSLNKLKLREWKVRKRKLENEPFKIKPFIFNLWAVNNYLSLKIEDMADFISPPLLRFGLFDVKNSVGKKWGPHQSIFTDCDRFMINNPTIMPSYLTGEYVIIFGRRSRTENYYIRAC